MGIDLLLSRLDNPRPNGRDRYRCACPVCGARVPTACFRHAGLRPGGCRFGFRDERCQRTSMNVSASTPAWRSTLPSVPTARSRRWSGTTQVTGALPLSGLGDCLRSTTWLPF
jgi:hypothetical protein